MSVTTSYPGIYIQELPSNTHTIAAAPTSVAVFVGYTHPWKTPNFNQALEIFSFTDYERLFGGFYQSALIDANVSYAVNEFFLNGGTDAFVVGLDPTTYYGRAGVGGSQPDIVFDQSSAAGIGFVSLQPLDSPDATLKIAFSAVSADLKSATIKITYGTLPAETYSVSLVSSDTNFIGAATGSINGVSKLVTVQPSPAYPATFPSQAYAETQSLPCSVPQGSTLLLNGTGIVFTSLVSSTAHDVVVSISGITADAGGNLTIAKIEVAQDATTETYNGTSLDPTDTANFFATKINGVSALITVAPGLAYPAAYPGTATETVTFTGTGAGTQKTLDTSTSGIQITALQPTDAVPMSVVINNVQADTNKRLTIADLVVTYGGQTETYRKISIVGTSPNFIETRINNVSALITVAANTAYPAAFPKAYTEAETIVTTAPAGAVGVFSAEDFLSVFQEDSSLDKVPVFNLLLTPGIVDNGVLSEALAFVERKLAFFIMDPPPDDTADSSTGSTNLIAGFVSGGDAEGNVAPLSPNGALYFPYLLADNPVTGLPTNAAGKTFSLPPSGYVAGIYAATDSNRGVWKAPAGLATTLLDTTGVVPGGVMTDSRQGVLNPLGVNCIRSFPGAGTVVFGARTLVTQNQAFQQWWYVPVRRMALFLEQTLKTNLTWAIFEPNDTPLWTAIRISIQGFMLSLYNQGAFAGATPSDAFQVKCDSTTTTPTDQANGTVNVIVAFAPLRPAEFVIVKIAQLAGQASS